jgi:predicted ArsR family transcriptional regulator
MPSSSSSRTPTRRSILQQLDGHALLVSELAAPFDISLQAVWRHIQDLVRAGLIQQNAAAASVDAAWTPARSSMPPSG